METCLAKGFTGASCKIIGGSKIDSCAYMLQAKSEPAERIAMMKKIVIDSGCPFARTILAYIASKAATQSTPFT